jgi:DNA replication protein DnaC
MKIPKRFWELPKIEKTSWNQAGIDAVDQYLKKEITGILFAGGAGTGKTVLACKVLHELIPQWPERGFEMHSRADIFALFQSVPALLMELRDSFNDKTAEKSSDLVRRLASFDHLVLDDLGAEKTSDWTTKYCIR